MELVLNTFGTSLSRENEGFLITYKDGKQRLPTEGIHSIQISRGAQITSDAVLLAIEKEIENASPVKSHEFFFGRIRSGGSAVAERS